MATYTPKTAWDLIGWDHGLVAIAGGFATYEAVGFLDSTPGAQVLLQRLKPVDGGIQVVKRYVDPDTLMVPADDDARAAWDIWSW